MIIEQIMIVLVIQILSKTLETNLVLLHEVRFFIF